MNPKIVFARALLLPATVLAGVFVGTQCSNNKKELKPNLNTSKVSSREIPKEVQKK